MSVEEQKEILKMVEEGKISAEDAMSLLDALEADDVADEPEVYEAEASEGYAGGSASSEFEAIAAKVRSFWRIPLWIGIGFTVLGSLWMLSAMRSSGLGFWFYCAWLPFFLGIGVIVLAAGSKTSRWLFVKVKQAPGATPQNIIFGFPLPLRFAAWILRTLGRWIPELDEVSGLDSILETLADSPSDDAALIVDVHDDDGEEVQVFIG